MRNKTLHINLLSYLSFSVLVACNAGKSKTGSDDGNDNYLPSGNYIQQNGTMTTILNGNNTPVYAYLCQSGVGYNIYINGNGQRCINGECTTNPLLIKQDNCFNSKENAGTLPNLPGKITSYSDSWTSCEYKSKYLTATRSITIHATANTGPYTLICTGNVIVYPN